MMNATNSTADDGGREPREQSDDQTDADHHLEHRQQVATVGTTDSGSS